MGETLAGWCYSDRPGQKSSTSLSTPHHLLRVEGIQWDPQTEREGEAEGKEISVAIRQGGICLKPRFYT